MKIFYFTSTGNSLAIAKKFDAELYSIPQVLKSDNDEFSAEAVGIICPIYHFGVPVMVKDFLTTVKIHSPYVFALLTYGNMTGNAPGHIDQLASSKGIKLSYISTIKMVDNFLPVFDMEKECRKIKESDAEINRKINDIRQRVNHRKISKNPLVIMSTPIIRSVMKETGIEKKFCISNDCTACGICQKVCPKNNIELDKRPHFGNNCCSCLGCVHMCPQKAITIKGEKNPNARFISPNVTLNEIIKANN